MYIINIILQYDRTITKIMDDNVFHKVVLFIDPNFHLRGAPSGIGVILLLLGTTLIVTIFARVYFFKIKFDFARGCWLRSQTAAPVECLANGLVPSRLKCVRRSIACSLVIRW